jgi:dihydrofolate reductase
LIILIAAIAENNAIGKNNKMLWHLPDDFKRFKRTTMGHTLIMGRKTFESLGSKPLPGRPHIVITRNNDYHVPDGVRIANSLEQAISMSRNLEKVYIIGGGEIYRQALPLAGELDITRVHTTLEGDVFFPPIDHRLWKEVSREYHPADDKHVWAFTFLKYKRR